jgi:hypothetical protein
MRYVYPALVVVVVGGCFSPPVEAPKTAVEQATTVPTNTKIKEEVDLLFVIDDSGSMAPKQEALKSRFPTLINVLEDFAMKGHEASYHIGVVTSDLGAPGTNCGSNLGGKLQQRGLAKTNVAGCLGPVGANFIEYDQRNGTDNFSATGQTLAETFSCMATVVDPDGTVGGHTGCGFESQLEAAYRALHDTIPDNSGFLRPNAILAVVWVTDEDDCSADPGSDLFQTSTAKYGPLDSYRCAQNGIVCDGMLLPSQPQASFGHCAPATPAQGGKLTDLERYVHFFTTDSTHGGIKADPSDVILAAITAPKDPVGTMLVTGGALCGGGGNCTNIAHSCTAADNPAFFGDPSQRLSYVVEKAAAHQLTSICDTDYKSALEGIADKILNRLKPACLVAPILDPAHPDCTVEDIDLVDGAERRTSLPFCGDVGNATPCWRLCNASDPSNSAGCTAAAIAALSECTPVCNHKNHLFQTVGVSIDRGTTAAMSSFAKVACNTVLDTEVPPTTCM